jgi:hypothetical protein
MPAGFPADLDHDAYTNMAGDLLKKLGQGRSLVLSGLGPRGMPLGVQRTDDATAFHRALIETAVDALAESTMALVAVAGGQRQATEHFLTNSTRYSVFVADHLLPVVFL